MTEADTQPGRYNDSTVNYPPQSAAAERALADYLEAHHLDAPAAALAFMEAMPEGFTVAYEEAATRMYDTFNFEDRPQFTDSAACAEFLGTWEPEDLARNLLDTLQHMYEYGYAGYPEAKRRLNNRVDFGRE